MADAKHINETNADLICCCCKGAIAKGRSYWVDEDGLCWDNDCYRYGLYGGPNETQYGKWD